MRANWGKDRKIEIDASGVNIIVRRTFCNTLTDRVSTRNMETLAARKETWMEQVIDFITQPWQHKVIVPITVPSISPNVFERLKSLELFAENVTGQFEESHTSFEPQSQDAVQVGDDQHTAMATAESPVRLEQRPGAHQIIWGEDQGHLSPEAILPTEY